MQFEDARAMEAFLAGQLQSVGLPAAAAGQIAAAIAPQWQEVVTPPPRPGRLSAVVPSNRWVITDGDLNWLETAGKALVAAFTAGLIGAAVATGAGVGIGVVTLSVELLQLASRMSKKGVTLDKAKFETLIALRSAQGALTAEELAKRLGHQGIRGELLDVTPATVEAQLKALSKTVVNDGTERALVVEENGYWRVADV